VRTLFAALTAGGMARRLADDETVPGRFEQVAEIYLEIDALSDDELDSELQES